MLQPLNQKIQEGCPGKSSRVKGDSEISIQLFNCGGSSHRSHYIQWFDVAMDGIL